LPRHSPRYAYASLGKKHTASIGWFVIRLVHGLLTDGNEYVWMAVTPAGNEFGTEFPRVKS